jgi:hypothetical protein
LKRIALVGYDSEKFHAEEAAYSALPGCCQYDRAADVKKKEILFLKSGSTNTTNEKKIIKQ